MASAGNPESEIEAMASHELATQLPSPDRLENGFMTPPLPQTSSARQRASISERSLDRDIHLAEEVEQHVPGIADEASAQKNTVLYLAYGSNLVSKTFRGRRGIKPLSQVNVLVPTLRLTFDLPAVPYAEPCMAGTDYRDPSKPQGPANVSNDGGALGEKSPLVPRKDYHKDRWHKPLVGVVYEVTISDYAKIIATEGGGSGYRDVVIDCYPFPENYRPEDPVPDFPDTKLFKAHTLLSPAADGDRIEAAQSSSNEKDTPITSLSTSTSQPSSTTKQDHPRQRPDRSYAQPSARYLKLIKDGAAEHNLPQSYREYLADIRPYRTTTVRQRIGKVVFLAIWAPVLILSMVMGRLFAGPDGRSPAWLRAFSNSLWIGMWRSYDCVFKGIFGDGERTYGE